MGVTLSLGGCALFVSFDDVALGGGAGGAGGGGGGASGGGGGLGGANEGGAGGQGVTCTLYVSPEGDASNDGRSPESPLASIGSALDLAHEGDGGETVCVCGRSYAEASLAIRKNTALRGGFDCARWARPGEVEYPQLAGTEVSITETGEPTLLIAGGQVDENTVVDGFRLSSTLSVAEASHVALVVDEAAAPRIENCFLDGSTAVADPPNPSVGVLAKGGAHPRLEGVFVRSGMGTGRDDPSDFFPGSAALAVVHARASLVGSWLEAGSTDSESPAGSVAVYVSDATMTIEDCHLHGGSGEAPSGNLPGSGGLVVREINLGDGPASVTIVDSVVHGGTGTADTSAVSTRGIGVTGPATLEVQRCAIFGGRSTGVQVGVKLDSASDSALVSNMIFGGISESGEPTTGVYIDGDDGFQVDLAYNTIEAGNQPGAAGIWIQPSGGAASLEIRLERNLFLSAEQSGIFVNGTVPLGSVFALGGANAFINPTNVLLHGGMSYDAADIGGLIGPDNLQLTDGCMGSLSCADVAGCATLPDCGLLTAYAQKTGAAVLTDTHEKPAAWRIDPASQGCELLSSASPTTSYDDVPDYYGAPRESPMSMGAHEHACD